MITKVADRRENDSTLRNYLHLVIVFPNCKINLGLRIFDRRPDEFHNIESLFYPVKWCDALEAIPSKEFSFQIEGRKVEGSAEDNLCVKAFRLLQKEFDIPPVKICLLKNIPVGAGLGGGSSDAAFTLKLLNDLFELKLSNEKLKSLAAQLGSDCVFFIENKPTIVSGRGEMLQPIHLDLSGYRILIVYPNISVNTASAYQQLDDWRVKNEVDLKQMHDLSIAEILKFPMDRWQHFLHNDFEHPIGFEFHQIAMFIEGMKKAGAIYTSLSGSGSAFFGIFEDKPKNISLPESARVFEAKL